MYNLILNKFLNNNKTFPAVFLIYIYILQLYHFNLCCLIIWSGHLLREADLYAIRIAFIPKVKFNWFQLIKLFHSSCCYPSLFKPHFSLWAIIIFYQLYFAILVPRMKCFAEIQMFYFTKKNMINVSNCLNIARIFTHNIKESCFIHKCPSINCLTCAG